MLTGAAWSIVHSEGEDVDIVDFCSKAMTDCFVLFQSSLRLLWGGPVSVGVFLQPSSNIPHPHPPLFIEVFHCVSFT